MGRLLHRTKTIRFEEIEADQWHLSLPPADNPVDRRQSEPCLVSGLPRLSRPKPAESTFPYDNITITEASVPLYHSPFIATDEYKPIRKIVTVSTFFPSDCLWIYILFLSPNPNQLAGSDMYSSILNFFADPLL